MIKMEANKAIKAIKKVYGSLKDDFTQALDERIVKIANKNGASEEMQAVRAAQGGKFSNLDRATSLMYNSETGERELLKRGAIGIAGGYMGLSAAGRIATGGGLYRDSDGNFDIIGIPIV